MMSVRGDPAASIPATWPRNPNLFNVLKNNQRHQRASPQTSRTIMAVSIAGEGSWYRPKQAMGMEPSGAAWPQ
jgi:hypothetical protein